MKNNPENFCFLNIIGFKYFDVPSHFKNEIFVQVSCSKRHCCAIDAYGRLISQSKYAVDFFFIQHGSIILSFCFVLLCFIKAYVHCFGDRNEIREEMIAPKHVNGKQSQSRSRPREEIGVYFDGEDENDNEYQTNDIKQTIHSISSLKKEAKIDVEEDGYDEYADEDEIEKEENEERELNNLLNLADSIGDNIESLSAETAAAMKAAVAARDAKEELRLQEIKEKELFNDLEILNRNRAGYIQFKQISVGDDYSCGITLDYNNLLCWGSEGKHDDMPRNITGPIKQVSVSKQGVCVIYDNKENDMFWRVTGKLQCWGAAVSKVPSSMMLSSISVSVSSDGSVENIPITSNNLDNTSNERWLQVKVGCGNMVCAVNDQSSLHCWGGQHVSGMQPPANLMIM